MSLKATAVHRKHALLIGVGAAGAIAVIVLLMILLYHPDSSAEHSEGPIPKLENATEVYTRTISPEEYDFYYDMVERDLAPDSEQDTIAEKAKEKASRSVAEFSLGQKLGLCQPYSFESLQRDMEKENEERKLKKENGEVIYGPQRFDLMTYFQYITSNLKLDVVELLAANADEEMQKKAQTYFEENRAKYQTITNIRYTVTENGTTEEKNLPYEEMRTLANLDGPLFDFLYNGSPGETMDYVYADEQRTVAILAIDREDPDFMSVKTTAIEDYVSEIYYEELIQTEMEHNLLEFPK